MSNPKKLVPSCTCPIVVVQNDAWSLAEAPQSDPTPITPVDAITAQTLANAEPQRQQNELPAAEMGLGRFVEPPADPQPQIVVSELPQLTAKLHVGGFDLPQPRDEEAPQAAPEAAGDPPAPDAAKAFVEAAVAVDRKAFTSTAEIMAAARVWCAENDALLFGPRALAEQLRRRRGVQAHSNGQRRGWRGVKLR